MMVRISNLHEVILKWFLVIFEIAQSKEDRRISTRMHVLPDRDSKLDHLVNLIVDRILTLMMLETYVFEAYRTVHSKVCYESTPCVQ